mmetsp:Transcript_12592/g.25347  ORF Transcript_12592/g.25347 Transcript_12592/m.25347 type:complete len:231 (-) Transcript_12592:131-823(-)
MIRMLSCSIDEPRKAGLPSSISNTTAPYAHKSTPKPSYGSLPPLPAISGDMYWGVPQTVRTLRVPQAIANPKSQSLTTACVVSVKSTLSGLTSRCAMPASWIQVRAAAICNAIALHMCSSTPKERAMLLPARFLSSRRRREPPPQYSSIARTLVVSSTTASTLAMLACASGRSLRSTSISFFIALARCSLPCAKYLSFLNVLTATSVEVLRWRARTICEKAPLAIGLSVW